MFCTAFLPCYDFLVCMETVLQPDDGDTVLVKRACDDSCILSVLVFFITKGIWRMEYRIFKNVPYCLLAGIGSGNVKYLNVLLDHFIDKTCCNDGSFIDNVIYLWIYPPRRVLLVYGDRPTMGLMKKISTRVDRFVIGETIHISEGIEKIKEKVENYQGVVICDIPSHERNVVLKYCYGKGIRSYTTPKVSDLIIRSAENQHMFDTPLLLSRNTGLTIEQCFIKRIVDIVLSGIALLFALPIMGIVSLCIKLEVRGSIIYKQKRLTFQGKEFYVYKFRSMREDAEKDGVARLAGENDKRITKTGKIIRSMRLDELPQLFNILKGDMSIVGPRPERPEIAKTYEEAIPEFVYRLKVKAGLTGYAQVYGKYNTTAYDKLKLDLMYIQNYSLRLDFEIMFRTLQILFIRESTEGVEEGQEIALVEVRK